MDHKTKQLFDAVTKDDLQAATELLSQGADVNARTKEHVTPLQIAVVTGSSKMVELLITHGAAIDVEDKRGNTPISLAKNRRNRAIITLLSGSSRAQREDSFNNFATRVVETSARAGRDGAIER